MNRQFEILVLGRANADLVLKDYTYTVEAGPHVVIKKGDAKFPISTDVAPSAEVDKVTAVRDLGDMVKDLDYMFRWGGGGINSLRALSELRTVLPQMGLTFVAPTRPDLIMGELQVDLVEHLDQMNVNWHLMNLLKLNFNFVLPGKNKLIIRNRPRGAELFGVMREQYGTMMQYINPAEGVLVNSLGHPKLTSFIVKNVHEENQLFYAHQRLHDDARPSQAHMLPKFRNILTVVTPSSTIDRATWVNDIFPYSGLIFNRQDMLRIFYGKKVSPEEATTAHLLSAIAQLRYGIPTEHGVARKIEDTANNVYVTLGRDGHLVAIGDTVYHLRMKDSVAAELDANIRKNRSSTTGAGDSFAAGIIAQETLGQGDAFTETAAAACTSVNKYLGFCRTVDPNEIECVTQFDLRKYITEKGLD